MKMQRLFVPSCFALMGLLAPAAQAKGSTPEAAESRPDANAILRQMSETLGSAKQFSFKGTREISTPIAAAKNLQSKSEIEVVVRRPNKLDVSSTSSDGLRRMVFDGSNFTLFDGQHNTYASVVLSASMDELPTQLSKTYGFVPPLADFMQSDPYRDFRRRAQTVSYLGLGTAGTPAVECHRVALKGKLADAELCIGTQNHLPLKMTARVKGGVDAGVDLKIEFSDWNLMASATDTTFVFTPPGEAQRIPTVTTADIRAAQAMTSTKK